METRRRVLAQMMMVAVAGKTLWGQQIGPTRQQPNVPGMPPPPDPLGRAPGPEVDPGGKLEAQQAKMRNTDRQKRLEADTDRLLALATELKQDVNKTDKNVLSVDVIKKADEIERLARSVKDRMKG